MEAVPARYDSAKMHSTTQCPWPPNPIQSTSRPRPNFRVLLVLDNAQDDVSDVVNENLYYDQNDVFESQFYSATLEEVTNDDENKDSFYYPNVFNLNQFCIQALPIRKVQTLSAIINGCNEVLTIDSGSEGNCTVSVKRLV